MLGGAVATTNMRTASRSPVTLKIKFKSTTLEQFIERYSVDISHGGIFIRTKDPLPVGTNLRFEFQLKDASPLITGDGTVVWTRDFDPTRSGVAPGMGVRFDRLPAESQEVLDQILAHKTAKMGKAPEAGFLDTPTKVAFGNVPTKVTPKEVLDGLAQAEARRTLLGMSPARSEDTTPLPRPLPFHNDLDEFPDEAFEEATKVASLDALARRSADPSEEPGGTPFGKSLEEDVTVERQRMSSRPPRPEEMERESPRERESGRQRELRESESLREREVAAGSPAPAPVPVPMFHGLPARSPFAPASDAREPLEARGERQAADQLSGDGSDPFSLPLDRAPSAARVSSRPLHIVEDAPPPVGHDDEDADDHADDDEEDGEGPTDAEIAPSVDQSPAVMDPSALARDGERDGSSTPWIAAAAVLLLIGGVGGFWLLRGRKDDGGAAAVRPPVAAAVQKTAQPPASATADGAGAAAAASPGAGVGAATAGNLEVTVAATPEGAIAELADGSQSGPTPMTFRGLTAGQSYRVKVSKAGFAVAELTVKPEAGDPPAIELVAKPSVLRVTSDPAGAQVYLNGRRQKSLTPADVEIPPRTAARKRVTLSLHKAGYTTAEQLVPLDSLVDQGDAMVQEVALVLARRPVQKPVTPADGEAEGEAGDQATDGEEGTGSDSGGTGDQTDDKSGDRPAGTGQGAGGTTEGAGAGSKPKESSDDAGKGQTPSLTDRDQADPIPDWMKPK